MPRRIWVAMFLVLGTSMSAFATTAYESEWTIGTGGTGTISYAGGASALVGSDIAVSSVVGWDQLGNAVTQSYTLLNDVSDPGGPLETGGLLDFTTGGFSGITLLSWNWGACTPPGALSLTGCLSTSTTAQIAAGNGACIAGETGTTTLVTDEFTSATIENAGLGTPAITFGGLVGTLDPVAAAAVGVSTAFVSPTAVNAFAFEDNASPLPSTLLTVATTPFSATQGQGTMTLVSAPEGGSVSSMLGIFVLSLGVFGFARRRLINPVAL